MKPIFLTIISLITIGTFAQKAADKSSIKFYKKIVSVLANDSLQGRPTSTIYEDKSAAFIVNRFKNFKRFNPKIQSFKYTRKDSLNAKTSKNVYCYIDNKSDSTIVIGAHFDHLGLGEGISRSYGKKGIHNGADDNASGVAMVLNLARNFKNWQNKKYNYVFVCYSAHEIGLFGSAAFSKFCIDNFKPICLLINFDMVGRLETERKILTIYGKQTLRNKINIFDTVNYTGVLYTNDSDMISQTDAKTFVEKNIRCLSFTTGIHSDYHKISDDESLINYNGMQFIENYFLRLLKKYN
jgi:Zn-dependent M28 family amino/carboxypeptidase